MGVPENDDSAPAAEGSMLAQLSAIVGQRDQKLFAQLSSLLEAGTNAAIVRDLADALANVKSPAIGAQLRVLQALLTVMNKTDLGERVREGRLVVGCPLPSGGDDLHD